MCCEKKKKRNFWSVSKHIQGWVRLVTCNSKPQTHTGKYGDIINHKQCPKHPTSLCYTWTWLCVVSIHRVEYSLTLSFSAVSKADSHAKYKQLKDLLQDVLPPQGNPIKHPALISREGERGGCHAGLPPSRFVSGRDLQMSHWLPGCRQSPDSVTPHSRPRTLNSSSCHNELTVILLHVCVRKFSLGAKSLVHRWWRRGRECTSPADPAVKLVNCLERFRCESQKNKDDKRQAQYLTLHSPQTTKGPQDLFVWSFITYNGSLYSHLVVVECCISTQLTTHNTCVIQKPFWNTFIINQNIITTCMRHWLKRIRMLTSVDSFEICLIVHLHGF